MAPDCEETGVPRLDDISGGLSRHGLTMVIGQPGAGKTVLALQIALHHARKGSDIVFLSAYSEPHEKLNDHLSGFSFFDPSLMGSRVTMLSLKSALLEGEERTMEIIRGAARSKHRPLLIIDGYRGVREALGADAARGLMAALSSQLPYFDASAIVTVEGTPHDSEQYAETASADMLIGLYHVNQQSQAVRIIEVIKVRGRGYREGLHGFAITSDGAEVYPRLASCLPASAPEPTGRRFKFGLPEFDDMLGGGLPEFSSTVFLGDAGTGRTTFSLHYLLAGAEAGEEGLLVAVRSSLADLVDKADNLGLDLRGHLRTGAITVIEIPPVEIDSYAVAWRIREMVEAKRPARLVVDTISDLEQTPGIQQAQQDYLSALSLYFRRSGITTVLTADTGSLHTPPFRSMNEVRMPEANNRVLVRRVPYRGKFHRICAIVNMEGSVHDTSIREFTIAEGGIRVLAENESESGVLAGIEQEQPAILDR